eukprot:6212575-Pleurochrysis_carterae.AAC.1
MERRMERLRGVASELDVLGAQSAPFVRGVERNRGAARLFKKRGAVVDGCCFSGRRKGAVVGVGGALRIELLRAFGAISAPMLTATVPAVSKTRRPFFVEKVRPLHSFRIDFLERHVVLLACTAVRLSKEGAVTSTRFERAFLLMRFELTENIVILTVGMSCPVARDIVILTSSRVLASLLFRRTVRASFSDIMPSLRRW